MLDLRMAPPNVWSGARSHGIASYCWLSQAVSEKERDEVLSRVADRELRTRLQAELETQRENHPLHFLAFQTCLNGALEHVRRARYGAHMPAQLQRFFVTAANPDMRYTHCEHCPLPAPVRDHDATAMPALEDVRSFLVDIDAGLTRHMPAAVKLLSTASPGRAITHRTH